MTKHSFVTFLRKMKIVLLLFNILVVFSLTGCFLFPNSPISDEYFTLTIEKIGQGTTVPDNSYKAEAESVVNLEATSAQGWEFIEWQGDVAEPGQAKTSIFMDENKTVTAVFEEIDSSSSEGMVIIPAGTTAPDNGNVTLEYEIEAGIYEVTNEDFVEFLNGAGINSGGDLGDKLLINMDANTCQINYNNGSFNVIEGEDPDGRQLNLNSYPVIFVTWYGAVYYCNWLSEQHALTPAYNLSTWALEDEPQNLEGYRLLTENEWKYCMRGGKDGLDTTYSGSDGLSVVGWYYVNSDADYNSNLFGGRGTLPVGEKDSNELGMYDMSGNVYEWINDSIDGKMGYCGGSWWCNADFCEVDYSAPPSVPGGNTEYLGFRIARTNR